MAIQQTSRGYTQESVSQGHVSIFVDIPFFFFFFVVNLGPDSWSPNSPGSVFILDNKNKGKMSLPSSSSLSDNKSVPIRRSFPTSGNLDPVD